MSNNIGRELRVYNSVVTVCKRETFVSNNIGRELRVKNV